MAIPYQAAKFKSANILQWRFRAQPPNLIPTNISGYTVDYNFILDSQIYMVKISMKKIAIIIYS